MSNPKTTKKVSNVEFSPEAFCMMILHAAKYPHCAINGVLLAKPKSDSEDRIEFTMAIPLFHITLNLTPMAEIALMQIDKFASDKGLVIAGYYAAHENVRNNSFEKARNKIAEKIAMNNSPSFLVVINNMKLSSNPGISVLKVAQMADGDLKQVQTEHLHTHPSITCVASNLLLNKIYMDLVDFDNHLDDITLDWTNTELNFDINRRLLEEEEDCLKIEKINSNFVES